MSTGILSSWGFRKESTQNTRAVVNRFHEHVSESVVADVKRIESKGQRGGRRTAPGWSAGNTHVGGGIALEMVPENAGALLDMCIGTAASTTGAGPYVHTFTPAALSSWTHQYGRPGTAGVTHPFEYTGMMVNSWSLSISADGDGSMIEFTMDFLGHGEDVGQSLVATAYPTLTARWTSVQASITVGGTAVPITALTLNGANNLRQKFNAQAAGPGLATIGEAGYRVYDGSFTADFKDLTQYNLYKAGTENALVLTIDDGTSDLVITTNARYDGGTPTTSGTDVIEEETMFVCTSETSDGAAITAVLTNADSTP